MIQLLQEFMDWSLTAFPDGDELTSLEKARVEIKELKALLTEDWDKYIAHAEKEEYVDVIMCLLFSAAKRGYTANEIMTAFAEKLGVNKKRKWKKNSDNTYQHIE